MIGDVCIGDMVNDNYLVPTIFGNQVSSPSYLKGKDHLYRIQSENGREVRATLSHRVLTPGGWRSLRDLPSQSLIFLDGISHDVFEKGKEQDYRDCYSLDFHLNGVLCNLVEAVFLNILLQLHKTVSLSLIHI